MPSPFPGMDPYLEALDIWPDLHDGLAGEIRAVLNRSLPAPYYARLEKRSEGGIVEDSHVSRRTVERSTVHAPRSTHLEGPRTAISEFYEVEIPTEPLGHPFVEIRDPSRGHELVTLLEIASPSNKQPGPDREAYRRKQSEVLQSQASLIELDLLRAGQRLAPHPEPVSFLERLNRRSDYLVLVNRAWRRAEPVAAYQIFPVALTETLPCIPVPLRPGEQEVPLDLQFVFQHVYDNGPYRRGAVDYSRPPQPPMPAELESWREACLRAAGW